MVKKIKDSLEHVPPKILKKFLSGCLWEGTPDSNVAALTFDDGPDPDITPAILDELDEIGARGTFFMTGEKVKEYPHLAAKVHDRGHTIGNHSMSHNRMFLMKKKEVEYEIDEAQKVLSGATGSKPVWFRPPYGLFDFTCADAVKSRGLSMVLWTVNSGDYSDASSEIILKTVEPFIIPGAIHVFHDTKKGGGHTLKDIIKKIGVIAEKKGIRLGSIEDISISKKMEVITE